MSETRYPVWRLPLPLYVVGAVGLTLAVWVAAGRGLDALAISAIAIGGAAFVAWSVPDRPVVAFGVLFLLASISRPTLHLPVGTMRLEQPAIAAAALALLLTKGWPAWSRWRHLLPIGAAFAAYLAILTASSLLKAPDRVDSLHLVAWTAISMVGGLVAFALLAGRPGRAEDWFRAAGILESGAVILLVLVFLVLGPVIVPGVDPAPGVQQALGPVPKAYGYSWEANLFASFVGAMVPFLIERFRTRRSMIDALALGLALFAFTLGYTRGAYLGLAAGLVAYGLAVVWRTRRPLSLGPAAVVAGIALIVGTALAPMLLPVRSANPTIADRVAGLFAPPAPGQTLVPTGSGATAGTPIPGGSPTPGPTPSPTPGPTPTPSPPPDTVEFRLNRLPMAFQDLAHSPIIGLGADSFGQRHADPTQADQPDHLAIMAVAVLYESGIAGTFALGLGFLLLLFALLRATSHPSLGGVAAAYLGAIVSLLVAYQATNAIHFGLNWILVGAAIALVTDIAAIRDPRAQVP